KGIPYAYAKAVYDAYSRAWESSTNLSPANPPLATRATVTIGKDGQVRSAKIVQYSGDQSMDNSVQRALDSVHFVQPFEPGATVEQRTVTIVFNLRKRPPTELQSGQTD
ncbi:MAG TPA: TonB family protein, partial [Bacillota bacterium]|nr:TonB family protein [Bacillota bacterium]